VRRPRGWIFDGELTIYVLVSPNLIQRSLPLPGCAYAMLELSWQLCVHPRLSPMTDSDGTDSSTRVHVVWHVWAPMATSHRARQKMPSLPEAPRGSTGRPGLSWVEEGGRTGRQVVKSYLPMSIARRKSEGLHCSQVLFFLGWWPLLFSQEWWVPIRCKVCGSPAVCH
jgi:hypothetical protein